MTVQVVGKEYGWKVRFPGEDGQLGTGDDVWTGPDFRLPVGVPLRLQVTSQDYLYLLKIPHLEVKVMAVPDMEMSAEIEISEPMEGKLTGDPLCGFRHESLAGHVAAVTWEEFVRWRRSQS